MKKIVIITVLALTLFSLSAAFVPFSYDRTSPLFSSPSRILEEEENIREVIAFPLTSNAQDLLFNSPSEVEEKQLREVHIKLR